MALNLGTSNLLFHKLVFKFLNSLNYNEFTDLYYVYMEIVNKI